MLSSFLGKNRKTEKPTPQPKQQLQTNPFKECLWFESLASEAAQDVPHQSSTMSSASAMQR